MSNYLNNLNQIIKINTAAVSNTENKDSFLLTTKRSRDDLNKIANYINNLLVPSFKSLASGPRYTYDAAQVGISGLTIVTYPEAQGNNSSNSELYWIPGAIAGTGRPATVKESFDYLLESLIDRVVEVQNSTIDLSGITDDIACNGFNLQKMQVDILGAQYPLDCTSNNIFNWPLAKHLYEILSQLTTGLDVSLIENLDNGSSYPDLSLNFNRSVSLNDLEDVNIDSVSIGNGLVFNGDSWVAGSINTSEATEENSGTVEVASARDIALVASVGDSTSGSSYLAVTTEALYSSLESDAVDTSAGEINLLRDKLKEVAFEKLTESSIFDLKDVEKNGIVLNNQSIFWDNGKFKNRKTTWSDIEAKPSFVKSIEDLNNVEISNVTTNHILYFDGDVWRNRVSAEESIDNEAVEDLVGGLFSRGTHSGVDISYDDNNSRINVSVTNAPSTLTTKVGDEEVSTIDTSLSYLGFSNEDGNLKLQSTIINNNDKIINFDLNQIITANTFVGNLEGNATSSTYSETANYSNYLNTPDLITLSGAIEGTANYKVGDVTNPTDLINITTTIPNTSISNQKLVNSKIVASADSGFRTISLGDQVGIKGKADQTKTEVNSSGDIVISLPNHIETNAATATKLKVPTNITLSGGVSGTGIFDGSSDLNIITTVNSSNTNLPVPTNSRRGGVLLGSNDSTYGNSAGYIERRYKQTFSGFIDSTFHVDGAERIIPHLGISSARYIEGVRNSKHLLLFKNPSSTKPLLLHSLFLDFIYSGTAGGTYQFIIGESSGVALPITPLVSFNTSCNGDGKSQHLLFSQFVGPGRFFGVYCTDMGTQKTLARGLTIQILGSIEIDDAVY